MSNDVAHSPSLANHLNTLISDRSENNSPNNQWLRGLSLPVVRESNALAEVVHVSSQLEIHPENSDMVASRLARVLWPALQQHSRSFQGKAAAVVVNGGEPEPTPVAEFDLMQTLKIDLTALERSVLDGMRAFGVTVDRIALYNIRLGKSNYNIVTAHCDREPNDWAGYRLWRAELNEIFGANLRLAVNEQPREVSLRSDQSMIAPEQLMEQTSSYYSSRRNLPMPRHLHGLVNDWRDIPFFSIDDGKTKRPEDLVHAEMRTDGTVALKVAIPIAGGGNPYFSPFEDRFCLGLKAYIDASGTPVAFKIAPALAHNSCPLDFFSVNQRAADSAVSIDSKYFERVQNIRANPVLDSQINALFCAADRLLARQSAIGSSLSIEILSNPAIARPLEPRFMQAELAISTIQHFAQHLMAQWALNAETPAPLVVLRPQFRDSLAIQEIKRIFPKLRHYDLYHPERRQEVAQALKELGREDLIIQFADAIRVSLKQRRPKIANQPEDLLPEDVVRFKYMRSTVGNVNNLQLLSTMVDGVSFSRQWLNRFTDALSLRRNPNRAALAKHRMEAQIAAANSTSKEYFS